MLYCKNTNAKELKMDPEDFYYDEMERDHDWDEGRAPEEDRYLDSYYEDRYDLGDY